MTKISAGGFDLNKFLLGGYETDIVSILYGSSGTGKTNFCLLAAVSQAKKGNKVIFMDTEGGFSSERVRQMTDSPEEHKKVLENILLLKPTNFFEQRSDFKVLLENISSQVSLIVVDGMTILYRLEFAEARAETEGTDSKVRILNAQLVRQIKSLAEIARKKNIPVLVTNQSYKWEDENKMVGGDILKYWSKCHIELTHEKGRRTARIVKHRSMPEKYLTFQIYDMGIRKRGWIN